MQALGQLTAGIAHNFNNMLAVMIGNLELAMLDLPTPMQRHLQVAENSARRAAEMVNQLMLFSRRGLAVARDLVAVDTVIRNTIRICQETFDRKIDMPVRIPDDLAPVMGNQNQLEQVLLNLCLNARDALEHRAKPFIVIAVTELDLAPDAPTLAADAKAGRFIRISVRDDGVGMDEETRVRVFEPFFTTKDVDKGTGLGLSTAFGIAQQHHGWIDCQSVLNEGSVFSLYLPVATGGLAASVQEDSTALQYGSGTVLLIDDEEPIRVTVTTMLGRLGYDVLLAAGGREGLEQYRKQSNAIDLVLLDLLMPDMSGEEVLAELRQLDPRVRVALFTGHETAGRDLEGVSEIIRKPARLDDLAKSLRRILEG